MKIKRAIQSYCKLIVPMPNLGIIVTEVSEKNWEVVVVVNELIYKRLSFRSFIISPIREERMGHKIKLELQNMFYNHNFNVIIGLEKK